MEKFMVCVCRARILVCFAGEHTLSVRSACDGVADLLYRVMYQFFAALNAARTSRAFPSSTTKLGMKLGLLENKSTTFRDPGKGQMRYQGQQLHRGGDNSQMLHMSIRDDGRGGGGGGCVTLST